MTVESKIIFRSDASEVARDVKTLKAARTELEKLRAGTAGDPRIALENVKGQNKIAAIRAQSEAKSDALSKKQIVDLNTFREKRAIAAAERETAAKGRLEAARRKAHERAESKAMATRPTRAAADEQRNLFGGFTLSDLKSGFDVAASVAMKVGEAVYRAGAAVVQAQAFKEDVSRGFAIIAKSKAEGDRVMRMANEAADMLGRSRAEVSGQFLDLLTKGFNPAKVDEITKRLADLSVVDPRANLEGLSRAIGQIAGKGRLQGQELLQLAEAGLETGDVYKALAKTLGKSVPEIIKLQEAGKLTSDIAVQGILDAIAAQTGGKGAGEAARAKAREDLSGLIRQIEAIPANLLFDVDAGPGLDRLKGTMREIVDFFSASSATGKETRQVLGDTINAFAEGIFGIDTSKAGGVTDTLKAILEVVRASKGDIKAFASGIASIGSAFASISAAIGKVAALRAEFEKLSGVTLSGFGGVFKGLLLGIPSIIAQTLSGAIQAITGFSLWDAGVNLVNSLAGGIRSAAQSVLDAVRSTVGGVITSAKGMLGIASPSKVFMEIGDYSAKGFTTGMQANDNAVSRAGADMAAASVGGATTAGLGTRSSRVSTTSIVLNYAPAHAVSSLGPKELEEFKALMADDRARVEAIVNGVFVREANAA